MFFVARLRSLYTLSMLGAAGGAWSTGWSCGRSGHEKKIALLQRVLCVLGFWRASVTRVAPSTRWEALRAGSQETGHNDE